MSIATATHTQTRITRLVDVISTTPDTMVVSWTLGTQVEFNARTREGLGRVRDWKLLADAIVSGPELCTGAQKLRAWLKSRSMTQRKFAARLGMNELFITKWLTGITIPNTQNRAKITRETGGVIVCSDWVS